MIWFDMCCLQQPACIKCVSCGECHTHGGGRGGRHRSMSDGSSDAEPSAAATRTLRKSNSTDCVNKVSVQSYLEYKNDYQLDFRS